MLKNLSQLAHTIENKTCCLLCDTDTPTHIVKECLFQFLKFLGQVEDYANQQKAQQQEQKTIEPVKEEPKPD